MNIESLIIAIVICSIPLTDSSIAERDRSDYFEFSEFYFKLVQDIVNENVSNSVSISCKNGLSASLRMDEDGSKSKITLNLTRLTLKCILIQLVLQ